MMLLDAILIPGTVRKQVKHHTAAHALDRHLFFVLVWTISMDNSTVRFRRRAGRRSIRQYTVFLLGTVAAVK